MPRTDENVMKIAQFIKGFVEREQTLEFDVSAVCAIIVYSTRSVSRQDKLSTRFNHLSEILGEAHTWAVLEKASVITAEHIHTQTPSPIPPTVFMMLWSTCIP